MTEVTGKNRNTPPKICCHAVTNIKSGGDIMDKKIGKIIEVFIPNEYNNNHKINVMDSNKIGFKVFLEGQILEIIQEQNQENSNIFRDDLVIISKQIISNKEFIDIEKYYGDDYE